MCVFYKLWMHMINGIFSVFLNITIGVSKFGSFGSRNKTQKGRVASKSGWIINSRLKGAQGIAL